MATLTAEFGERAATASGTGETISFGRGIDVTFKLDRERSDATLSRTTGVFQFAGDHWQVLNSASSALLEVFIDGGMRATLAPGSDPLLLPTPSSGRVQVQTVRTYQIYVAVTGGPNQQRLPEPVGDTTTVDIAKALELTDDELLLLVGLAEPRLLNPEAGSWAVASTIELQDRLNLTGKQIDRHIGSIAEKFSPFVIGLVGTNLGRAVTRRYQIVDFAIRSGCIASKDLSRLGRK